MSWLRPLTPFVPPFTRSHDPCRWNAPFPLYQLRLHFSSARHGRLVLSRTPIFPLLTRRFIPARPDTKVCPFLEVGHRHNRVFQKPPPPPPPPWVDLRKASPLVGDPLRRSVTSMARTGVWSCSDFRAGALSCFLLVPRLEYGNRLTSLISALW